MKKTDPPIVVSTVINATIEKAWAAITELSQMKQWFFPEITSFEARVGFDTSFPVVVGDRVFTHHWTILYVKPMETIKYRWRYDEYEGDSHLTFHIVPEQDAVRVEVAAKVIEDFPQDIPEFTRESCIGGWNYFLRERLKPFLKQKSHPS